MSKKPKRSNGHDASIALIRICALAAYVKHWTPTASSIKDYTFRTQYDIRHRNGRAILGQAQTREETYSIVSFEEAHGHVFLRARRLGSTLVEHLWLFVDFQPEYRAYKAVFSYIIGQPRRMRVIPDLPSDTWFVRSLIK